MLKKLIPDGRIEKAGLNLNSSKRTTPNGVSPCLPSGVMLRQYACRFRVGMRQRMPRCTLFAWRPQ